MSTLPAATRYPGEGENAYAAFSDYLAMGWDMTGETPRRIPRLNLERIQRKHQPNAVDGWMKQFDWEERANLFDSAIVQGTAETIRGVCVSAQTNLATFAGLASGSLMAEFERSLEAMRRKNQTIDPVDLVAMFEKLSKSLASISPPNPDDGKRYNPDLGGYPEDQLLAEECARMDRAAGTLEPGEPPIPGVTRAAE